MSNNRPLQYPPRAMFFGMQGAFSAPSLLALLGSGIEVCAVVVPATPLPGSTPPPIQRKESPHVSHASRAVLPIFSQNSRRSIIEIAHEKHIPVWEVQKLGHQETIVILEDYQVDIICVACFPLLIPRAILRLPRLGCLNVHPSLLPQNRGPEPLFWTFREGHDQTGVTIHLMDEGMDRGAILAQESISVFDGMSYQQLEGQCATSGGELLAHTAWELSQGRAHAIAQDEAKSSYHSFPAPNDFVVNAREWSARHVYNFIKGVGHWDGPVELLADDKPLLIYDAASYSREGENSQHRARTGAGEQVEVRCRDGWVYIDRKSESN